MIKKYGNLIFIIIFILLVIVTFYHFNNYSKMEIKLNKIKNKYEKQNIKIDYIIKYYNQKIKEVDKNIKKAEKIIEKKDKQIIKLKNKYKIIKTKTFVNLKKCNNNYNKLAIDFNSLLKLSDKQQSLLNLCKQQNNNYKLKIDLLEKRDLEYKNKYKNLFIFNSKIFKELEKRNKQYKKLLLKNKTKNIIIYGIIGYIIIKIIGG